MVVIRSVNEIILSLIDYYRVVQPELDTKPGSVARDLVIDGLASQLSLLYDEVAKISNLQSLRLVFGSDLDKLAQNYGATRKSSVKASGIALLTFSSLPAIVNINKGELITSSSGSTFAVLNGLSVNPSNSNLYKSIATKFKNDLDFLGITDQYAVEVSVQATTPGSSGNISKYSLTKTNIPSVSNVTNTSSFSGGSNQEDDATFRNRVLAVFSGSNIGTSLGYKNTALSDSSVLDALVVEPGDVLMTRDGTVVSDSQIVSEGTGGKVDVIILGKRASEHTDSFIYRDASNTGNPADDKNSITLGQISGDENKTITRKRIDEIANGVLPSQPVDEVLEVSGSLSGSNYKEKQTDSLGRITGNYEIVKDTGVYKGSPFGFDKFKWISDRISLFEEDRIKSDFNGQDTLTFTGVQDIPLVQQNISILNENSVITSDRSVIQLLHTPCTNITRVFNVNTGERYVITDQNIDGDGTINNSGRIKISGSTLPSFSDQLQVDYTWIINYDPSVDYDGISINKNKVKTISNIRNVEDSVDWGLSNNIKKEDGYFTKNTSGTLFIGKTKHPISSISYVNTYTKKSSNVYTITDPTSAFYNRKAIIFENAFVLDEPINSIDSVVISNTNKEIYNTAVSDGTFINTRVVVGLDIKYKCQIIFPSDTLASDNDSATVVFNTVDVFNVANSVGSFSNNQITIPISNTTITDAYFPAKINYICDVQNILLAGINNFSISRNNNSFINNKVSGFANNFTNNILIKENQSIQKNILNQYYVDLNALSSEVSIESSDIICVIRLTDGLDLWSSSPGSVEISNNGNYQLILSGINSPAIAENVLIIYDYTDLSRTQPFTFKNKVFIKQINTISFDYLENEFYINIIPDIKNYNKNQVMAIRLLDSKNIWTQECSILNNGFSNKLIFPQTTQASVGDKILLIFIDYRNLKQSPTRLLLTTTDQTNNSGTITVSGTTITRYDNIIFSYNGVSVNDSIKIRLFEAFKKALGLSSSSSLSSNYFLARIAKLEKITTTSNDEVLSVDASYDLFGSTVYNNIFYSNELNIDESISGFEFILPKTSNNLNNLPLSGEKLRISFYIGNSNDSENIAFTKNGTLYTNKKFALIDKLFISSGFNNSQSVRFGFSNLNQPLTGSRYKTFYDYLAPKQNERIIIRYNYNKLVSDVSFLIENTRPINADVLVREASKLLVDITLNIVVKNEFLSSASIVLQNVKNKLISAINTNVLNDTLDSSDLVFAAQSTDGVDRVRVMYFNENGKEGQVLSLSAQKDQYFSANNIIVNQESR